jgi:subtilisin family serine protease
MWLLRKLWELICRLLGRWGLWYCRRRGTLSPVIGVEGAWVRPREVLVDTAVEAELADRLRELGGRPYAPSDDQDDWRRSPFAPDYGDVNARLDEAGLAFHLWVGFSTRDAVKLAREVAGVHFNVVYLGEGANGYYQGGPDGYATPDSGPQQGIAGGSGDNTVDVAVLDSGLPVGWTSDYPALRNTVTAYGADDPVGSGQIVSAQGCHGLFICGLITRIDAELDIESHRVMWPSGEIDDSKACPAIISCGGAVVNLSFGGYSPNAGNAISQPMADALDKAVAQDKILVAAAGNDGGLAASSVNHDVPFWPAAYEPVIAVGAYVRQPTLHAWPKTNQADLYAPGVGVLSMHAKGLWKDPVNHKPYGGWGRWSGTSFATPVVAATIASDVAGVGIGGRRTAADKWLKHQKSSTWLGKPPQPQPPASPKYGRIMDPAPDLTIWPAPMP